MLKHITYAFFAAALLLSCCGCTANSGAENAVSETVSEAQPEATAAPQSRPEQLTLEQLIGNGTENDPVSIEYRDSSDIVSSINGRFYSEPVKNAEDAIRLFASLADALHIQNFDDEIQFESEDHSGMLDIYDFRQYYKGIPVTASVIRITVRTETNEAVGLLNGYVPDLSISTEPKQTAAEIKQQTADIFSDNRTAFEPELAIFCGKSGQPKLVWNVYTENQTKTLMLLIDDADSEILYQSVEQE